MITTRKYIALLWIALPMFLSIGHAAERHALIIGNAQYADSELLNPENDAIDIAEQLSKLGYIIHGNQPFLNLDRLSIERTVRAFINQLPTGADSLVYFAGHGISTGRDNYLIPVNHQLEDVEGLPDRAVSLRATVNRIKNANPDGTNVVLIDACRDNPLQNSYRSLKKGLAPLEDVPRGVFIGYAADVGQVAEDGAGRNGTYTQELLYVMKNFPSEIIEVAHKRVATRVFNKTRGEQFPVSENKIFGNWCFGVCAPQNTAIANTAIAQDPPIPSPVARQPAEASQNTQPATLPEATTEKSSSKKWLWAAAAGVGLAAILLGGGGGGDDSEPSNFTLIVEPPE